MFGKSQEKPTNKNEDFWSLVNPQNLSGTNTLREDEEEEEEKEEEEEEEEEEEGGWRQCSFCSAMLASVAAPPSGARQGSGGPNLKFENTCDSAKMIATGVRDARIIQRMGRDSGFLVGV